MKELKEIDNNRPFQVPDGYFDNFSVQLESLITEEQGATKKVRLRSWLSVAAAAVIAVVLLGQIYTTDRADKQISETRLSEYYILSQVNENSLLDYYLLDDSDAVESEISVIKNN